MPELIDKPVGAGGVTYASEKNVLTVVRLLNAIAPSEGGAKDKPLAKHVEKGQLIAAIHRFQFRQFGISNGRVDPDNVTISQMNKLVHGTATGPQAFSAAANTAMIKVGRQRIVDTAKPYIGKVSNAPDAERRRTGWRLLKQIFDEVGLATESQSEYERRLAEQARNKRQQQVAEGVIPFDDFLAPHRSQGTKGTYPGGVRWCGVFATWVLRQVGFPVKWVKGKGIAFLQKKSEKEENYVAKTNAEDGKGATLGITLGDVCVANDWSEDAKDPERGNPKGYIWHHVIVASEPDAKGNFDVIEGNYPDAGGTFQCIVDQTTRLGRTRRNVKDMIAKYEIFRPLSL
jgi:hypothetical protein